jgi:hypothetical protein
MGKDFNKNGGDRHHFVSFAYRKHFVNLIITISGFRCLEVAVLAFGTQVGGFRTGPKPSDFFRAKKKKFSARLPSEGN